jgi:subtilisin family serine protease
MQIRKDTVKDPNVKEYIVVNKRDANWQDIHNDLTRDTSADSSIDSNIVPDRIVTTVKLRNKNPRLTHYNLTDDEAEKLSKDPRIKDVELKVDIPYKFDKYRSGNFSKDNSNTGDQQNWGLLRHCSKTNNFGVSQSDPGGDYDYVLDGTGVDVVIMDSGIEKNHPEFQDENGVSRVKEINWFTAAGVGGTWPGTQYQDSNGHGTHVTGTVAGKTFGWAKNADIYILRVSLGGGDGVSLSDANGQGDSAYDLVRLWHNKKNDPNDAAYTGRPTVCNMSFGVSYKINISNNPNTVEGYGNILAATYRGTDYYQTTLLALQDYGMNPSQTRSGIYKEITTAYSSTIAEIEAMADAGIVCTKSAGNTSSYNCDVGDSDQNNVLWWYVSGSSGSITGMYAHRGAITSLDDTSPVFFVGALDASSENSTYDKTSTYSDRGPGVNIWTAGTNIMSALSNTNAYGYSNSYNPNNSYKQRRYNGTSMAAPQMAGIAACILQAHPDWTPKQVFDYVRDNASDTIYSSNSSTDWSNSKSILGASQKVAYFPMSGRKPFSYG